jgi:ABC-type microcin C transport system duplicated ATPase subunit YejF
MLRPREVLGVIGESGLKSTLAGALAGTAPRGRMRFQGQPLPGGAAARSREQRRRIQTTLQDPLSSLNPRQRVGTAIARPMQVFFGHCMQAWDRAGGLLEELGLEASYLSRYPRQLSAASSSGWRSPARWRLLSPSLSRLRRVHLGAGCHRAGAGDRSAAAGAGAPRAGAGGDHP